MRIPEKYPGNRAVQAEASEILSVNGNRLKMIEALILCLLLLPLYFSVYNLIAFASGEFVAVPSAVLMCVWNGTAFFITLLIAIPLVLGLFGMAERMERGEDTVLIDLFAPFSSWSSYMSSVWLSWRILWIPSLAALLMWGSVELFEVLLITDTRSATILGWFFAVVFGALGLFFMMRRFTAIITVANGQCNKSELSGWQRYKLCDLFFRMYLLRILLGILSIGVLLLLDVIPEMLIAYYRYYKYMNDNNVTSEEQKYE